MRGARTRRARAPEGARAKLEMKVDEGSGCEGEGSGERDDENVDEGAARAGSGGEKAFFIAAEFERSLFFEMARQRQDINACRGGCAQESSGLTKLAAGCAQRCES